MEHTKKMILIDPKIINVLKANQRTTTTVPDPTSDSVRDMDETMRDVLESKDPTYDKVNHYEQTLLRYLKRLDQLKQQPVGSVVVRDYKDQNNVSGTEGGVDSIETKEKTWWESEVLKSVPKSMQSKAERLLSQLKNADPGVMGWTPRGELEYQGQVIKHSNVVDLVNDVLRRRKKPMAPGWRAFGRALQDLNVPRELVGNPEHRQFMDSLQASTKGVRSNQNEKEQLSDQSDGSYKKEKKRKKKDRIRWEPY